LAGCLTTGTTTASSGRNLHFSHGKAPKTNPFMQTNHRYFAARISGKLPLSSALLMIALSSYSSGAQVTLNTTNGIGESSFSSSLYWSDAQAPSSSNDYVVTGGKSLRTLANGTANETFAGNTLTLTDSSLLYKGNSSSNLIITVPNLTLNNSQVNNASNSSTSFSLAGNVTLTGTGTTNIFANNGSVYVPANLYGNSGTLELRSNGSTSGRQIILQGTSSFTGSILVTGLGGAVLDTTGVLTFKPGANGATNKITGSSPIRFAGTFIIDLSGASNTIGDSWQLVDASNLTETYDSTFSVQGFQDPNNLGVYTSTDGRYQFSKSTGALTRVQTDADGDGLPDAWEISNFGSIDSYGPNDDPDGDHCSNLIEYQAGTNPNSHSSFPDTDADGLPDPWETYYFPSLTLAQVDPSTDADGDYATNLQEFQAGTDPANYSSFPDDNYNGISDAWEKHYFPSIPATSFNPDADPDGDRFTNSEEFLGQSNPTLASSTPDTDGDGLPDGWELQYFSTPGSDRDTVISTYGAEDDPDGDGFTNKIEYLAGTNPSDAASAPTGTLAYWRFEEKTSGTVPGDAAWPGGGAYEDAVLDSSVFGSSMRTYNNPQNAPEYFTDVPFTTVPSTQAANTASLYFDAGTDGSWGDVLWTQTGKLIRSLPLSAWTVELSFKLDPTLTGSNQGIITKDGNPLGGQPPFHIKYLTTGKLEVGMIDSYGTASYLVGLSTIEPGTWYSVAVTGDSSHLSLWVKKSSDSSYALEGQSYINASFYNYANYDDAWGLGRARWNGGETDWFKGWIDEIRITGHVLTPTEFLGVNASSGGVQTDADADGLPDSWEIYHFGSIAAYGPNDDPDGDLCSNLSEYRAGTNPNSASSYPDTDADGLPDGWETYYFPSLTLAQVSPSDDPDGDYSTNLQEFQAGSDPNNYGSFPDTNNNGVSDGWEKHYFPSIPATSFNAEADPDGDSYTNYDEFWAKTDPTVKVSSPDSDGDGLPDGWEIQYFGTTGQDRDTIIALYDENGDPDGDGYSNKIEYLAGTIPTDAASAPTGTLAYWRFEEKTSGVVPGDSAWPGGGAYENAVLDSSIFGSSMRTYNNPQNSPEYFTDVPFTTVAATQATNTASLYFDAGTDGSWGDVVWTQTGKLIRSMPMPAWTVELSFKLDPALTGGYQGIITKDGNPLGGQPPFHIKYLTSGKLEIGIVDATGTAYYLEGQTTIEPGTWYSIAATGDSSHLSLWIKKPGNSSYTLDGQASVNASFYQYDGYDDAWGLGRARWNGAEVDWFKGWIDEVRITGHVLAANEFLAASTSADPYTAWAETNITDATKRGQSDDADGDGTTNYDEYLLGLNPADGSSRFAASISGGSTLSWPAANGLSFTIQRSTTLAADSWVDLATMTATGSTQTWSDPSPPDGKAFYRVKLNN
jgi:Concanavalin A-like lectin/glucanases superfamily/Bacterial TSP3 repeat